MENQTTDLEIKGVNSDLLIYFEILCKKMKSNLRKEFIDFMDRKVTEALKNNQITPEDKNNYIIEIEEY